MAAGQKFKITELQSASNGGGGTGDLISSGVSFEWDARTMSSPRGAWEYGIKLRTVRQDYPGSDVPTEQVLGPNYTPFTLSGIWDNRYVDQNKSPDFAENTRKAFEQMVGRGNLCQFEFETLKVVGLITELKIGYRRDYQIAYSFTVSPHFRNPGGDFRGQPLLAPQAMSNPDAQVQKASQEVANAQKINAQAPKTYLNGSTYGDITNKIGDMTSKVQQVQDVIQNRTLFITPSTPISASAATVPSLTNSLSRVVQSFQDMTQLGLQLLTLTQNISVPQSMFYESPISSLQMETWQRGLASSARTMVLLSSQAATQLSAFVTPDAIALYRPDRGESLYGISQRFYGTPFSWRIIADANNLFSMALQGDETLVIPKANL